MNARLAILFAGLISGALASAGCGSSSCGPSNCTGCCDASGICQTVSAANCGLNGAACATCVAAESCVDGICAFEGGNAAGGNTGGGNASATNASTTTGNTTTTTSGTTNGPAAGTTGSSGTTVVDTGASSTSATTTGPTSGNTTGTTSPTATTGTTAPSGTVGTTATTGSTTTSANTNTTGGTSTTSTSGNTNTTGGGSTTSTSGSTNTTGGGSTTSTSTSGNTGGTVGGTCPSNMPNLSVGQVGGSCINGQTCSAGFTCTGGLCILNGANGPLQVTLSWDVADYEDLDLHVVEPSGCAIWYGDTNRSGAPSSCGAVGSLDLDSNAGCPGADDGVNIENVIYPAGSTVPTGTYKVVVDAWEVCDSRTSFNYGLQIRQNGVITTYCGTLQASDADQCGQGDTCPKGVNYSFTVP